MYIYGFDTAWFLLVLPAMIFGMYASYKVNSTFNKFNSMGNQKGYTGFQVARYILDMNGLQHIAVERVQGKLSDHYDPKAQVIRLSDQVFNSTSVGAIGVAAHEVGHAIQYQQNYTPIKVRSVIIPVTQIGSFLWFPLFVIGLTLESFGLALVGLGFFALVAVFQLVTLPVEFDASNRAISVLESTGILQGYELDGAKKVLKAAAMTYVAALITALAQLLRFALIFLNRRD